jgi:hypothetical protein
MLEAEKYKRFTVDCIRIAETLSDEDQQKLLKIADVWTERALEVETMKPGRKTEPGDEGEVGTEWARRDIGLCTAHVCF